MKNSFSTLLNMKKFLLAFSVSLLLCACSKEEEKLPDLPKIAAPTTVFGEYVGRLPSENAKAYQIRMNLDSAGTAIVTENILRDTIETRIDTAAYEVSEDILSIKFSERTWKFKKNGDFGYVFLNPQGEPYVDGAGSNYALLRILNKVGNK